MEQRSGREAFNRGVGRHHVLAAAGALFVSLGLHATLFTRLADATLLRVPAAPETRRFTPIVMESVRPVPPPPPVALPRDDVDRPTTELPPGTVAAEAAVEVPAPVVLPLPAPAPAPVTAAASPPPPPETATAVRQEVLAIAEQTFSEEVSALPRRWVEADIPRTDLAPDIQLPVRTDEVTAGSDAVARPSPMPFVEDPEAGTPDWAALLLAGRGGVGGGTGEGLGSVIAASRTGALTETLEERPDEVSELTPVEDALQVRVAGYQETDGPDGPLYFSIAIERASERLLPVQPRDVLLVQDSSESMTPWKLDECRRGLKRWLDFLNPEDRFQVVGFRESAFAGFDGWVAATPERIAEARTFIDGLRATGDTDVYRSLAEALRIERDPARTMLLVLVSDGRPTVGVTGSSDIIEGITRENRGGVSMYTVGGGKKVNSFLLDLLSYRNRGDAIVARGEEEIPAAMESWARQLRRPVLTDLTYRFQNIAADEIYPKQLAHLFLDRPLTLHGRLPAGTDRLVFQVIGRAGEAWQDMVFVIDRSAIAAGGPELRQRWAWQKVYHLIGDYLGGGTEADLEAIRDFADHYGLIVPYGFSRVMPRAMR